MLGMAALFYKGIDILDGKCQDLLSIKVTELSDWDCSRVI